MADSRLEAVLRRHEFIGTVLDPRQGTGAVMGGERKEMRNLRRSINAAILGFVLLVVLVLLYLATEIHVNQSSVSNDPRRGSLTPSSLHAESI